MNTLDIMRKHNACSDAIDWVLAQTGTPQQIWESCERGDWSLWLAARIGVNRKSIVTAACLCAREVLPRVTPGEERPLIAIEMTEKWTRGEADIAEVRAAAKAADAAAFDAFDTASDAAASYAAAARVPCSAAYAAGAAAYADGAATVDAARAASLARSADLVRSVISWSAIEAAIGGAQ